MHHPLTPKQQDTHQPVPTWHLGACDDVGLGLHQQHRLVHFRPQHLCELQGRLLVLLQARHVLQLHTAVDRQAMLLLVVLLLVKERGQQLQTGSPIADRLGAWQRTAWQQKAEQER